MRVRRLLLPVATSAVFVVAGCTGSSSGDDATPTASATTSAATSPSASPSPSTTAFTTTCGDALSVTAVGTAARQPIIGRTSFVVGEPDPSIGRLAYLNCRYGIAEPTPGVAADPKPALEIGVSLYDSAKRATDRVASTVDDYASSGSAAAEVRVGTATGTVLTAPGQPATLVVAAGARTVAVTIIGRVFLDNDQIVAIAALAIEKAV